MILQFDILFEFYITEYWPGVKNENKMVDGNVKGLKNIMRGTQ